MKLFWLVAGVAALYALSQAQTPETRPVKVVLDGTPIRFDRAGAREAGGRLLVPLRGIFEKMGAEVDWNAGGQTVRIMKGVRSVQLAIGDTTAIVNGDHVTMDAPAQIENGRTLVPLRLVGEALGATVVWNSTTEVASITSATGARPTPKSGY